MHVDYRVVNFLYFHTKLNLQIKEATAVKKSIFDNCLVKIALCFDRGVVYHCTYLFSIRHYDRVYQTIFLISKVVLIYDCELTFEMLYERLKTQCRFVDIALITRVLLHIPMVSRVLPIEIMPNIIHT